jgi:RNA 3'-terminal phosphate cyclase (ATP)
MTRLIDGSRGEGGGQVLRTSLALSLITRQAFSITNIRKQRSRPGLLRQHLACVEAARIAGAADVLGAHLGSDTLTFTPRALDGGDISIAIGTAGSTTLVLQTVLLPLLFASGPSTLSIEGGTHNPLAPPVDFIQDSFLRHLRAMGANVTCALVRPGFTPAGGGELRIAITPLTAPLSALSLLTRGALKGIHVHALLANVARKVGERELATVTNRLQLTPDCGQITNWDKADIRSSGNALTATVQFEHTCASITTLGAFGKRAEQVANELATQVQRLLASDVAVCEYLADQLILPLALGSGGTFCCGELSLHALTQLALVAEWLQITPVVTQEHGRTLLTIPAWCDAAANVRRNG